MADKPDTQPEIAVDPYDCGPEACSITASQLTAARVESADPFEAMETYFERGWTDGLPIVPPTPARVADMLDAANIAPHEVLARVETRENVEVTAEKLAINAVMAGAKPEYMPVIVAAMRALADPMHNLHSHTATLMGAVQVAIINGPVRQRLNINSTDGAFGPGFRANATIGRALRLTIRNVLRSVPGEFDRAAFSHPGRFSWCFGEDEEESPWATVSEDQGFARGQDTVTMYATGWQSTIVGDTRDAKELVHNIGWGARQANLSGWRHMNDLDKSNFSSFRDGRKFLFVTGREHIRVLHGAGMDKRAVQEEIYRCFTAAHADLPEVAVAKPENILIACVRGTAMYQTFFFFPFHSSNPITRLIG